MATSDIYRSPIGTKDVLGSDGQKWEYLVSEFAKLARLHNFEQIITPTFENYEVFMRMGEDSDVVSKEMYDFYDKGERHIALRPEGTAGVVRAFAQNRPLTPFKAWYLASVFRYERPQKGRLREHHQLGLEVLGVEDPLVDVEVISFANSFFKNCGLSEYKLLINSLGDSEARAEHEKSLRAYFEPFKNELGETFSERVDKNPFRVLDTKVPEWRSCVESAPSILDFLSQESLSDFEVVKESLTSLGIEFEVKSSMVRGLDYYTNTAFEFVSTSLDSAQSTICAGGRYNKLVEELGGPPTAGIGFGLGLERLMLACEAEKVEVPTNKLDFYLVDLVRTNNSRKQFLELSASLRAKNFAVDTSFGEKSIKAAMKVADRIGAIRVIILGQSEIEKSVLTLKDMESGEQSEITTQNLLDSLF